MVGFSTRNDGGPVYFSGCLFSFRPAPHHLYLAHLQPGRDRPAPSSRRLIERLLCLSPWSAIETTLCAPCPPPSAYLSFGVSVSAHANIIYQKHYYNLSVEAPIRAASPHFLPRHAVGTFIFTMEPLTSLVANAPDWVKRLDELSGQVEQRQLDLANLAKLQEKKSGSPARSIRNRGSTESLKPKDDGDAFPMADLPGDTPATPGHDYATRKQQQKQQPPHHQQSSAQAYFTPDSDPKTPSLLQKQTEEVAATAQRRARAVLRKRQKTDSMVSAEGVVPTYRSRSMIIVYYDSFVQSFFEELVKFVSAQRNQMRKAKMAAKVAEIKRLAELEMPDDDDDDDILQPGDALIAADPKISAKPQRNSTMKDPRLHYMSTRIMGPTYRTPNAGLVQMRGTLTNSGAGIFNRGLGSDQPPSDIYDELDRALEFVQGMCERAAHQFLRDGDCTEEIQTIKKRLDESHTKAAKEMDRLAKEDPDALTKPDSPNPRSYRPSTMRRDCGASAPKKTMKVEVDDEGFVDM
ncbi:hypothetical protein SCUP234_02746 [Seiridium cupressi]